MVIVHAMFCNPILQTSDRASVSTWVMQHSAPVKTIAVAFTEAELPS